MMRDQDRTCCVGRHSLAGPMISSTHLSPVSINLLAIQQTCKITALMKSPPPAHCNVLARNQSAAVKRPRFSTHTLGSQCFQYAAALLVINGGWPRARSPGPWPSSAVLRLQSLKRRLQPYNPSPLNSPMLGHPYTRAISMRPLIAL